MYDCTVRMSKIAKANWDDISAQFDVCEEHCPRYSCCDDVAAMNDRLIELEEEK